MPERKQLLKLNIITDDDTNMYTIGEIDGMFQKHELEAYLKSHGEKGMTNLARSLMYLQWQVTEAWRNIHNTPENMIAADKND